MLHRLLNIFIPKKWDALAWIGYFFILFWAVDVVVTLLYTDAVNLMYLCRIVLLLTGIGLLRRNWKLVSMQFVLVATYQLWWMLDLLLYLAFGFGLSGNSLYLFEEGRPFIRNLLSLSHVFFVPLTLYCILRIRKFSWDVGIWAFFESVLVFTITYLVSPPEKNINFVHGFFWVKAEQTIYDPFVFFLLVVFGHIWTSIIPGLLILYLSHRNRNQI